MWNKRHVLAPTINARSLIETVALFIDIERRISNGIEKRYLESIQNLLNNEIFSTRLEKWIVEGIGAKSINILGRIDKLDVQISGI